MIAHIDIDHFAADLRPVARTGDSIYGAALSRIERLPREELLGARRGGLEQRERR